MALPARLAAEDAERRGATDGLVHDLTDLVGSVVSGETIDALDQALKGIQTSPYASVSDRRAVKNLRGALDYYVTHGHIDVSRGKKVRVDGEMVNLGRWLGCIRYEGLSEGQQWVRPVLDALGMRWGGAQALVGGDVRPAPSRPVRGPQASERDLKHPEWDLIDGEWALIEELCEGVVGPSARRLFNAVMFRFRNGLSMRKELPRGRCGAPFAGRDPFYRWARADVLSLMLESVEKSPGVMHPVVERALRAALDAA
ncbi:hypothetical protein AB0M86_45760 [Streptomyces sp. NPDC051639]|uniref:hypothetical protein n=1 Tax=Streptomyces sp. NPDC051639 TaxID=3155671 RepID=UPI003432FDB7